MASKLRIRVNERLWTVAATPDTPLLYVLSNELLLQGPRFGCGLAQCGSCSVLVNDIEIRSCVTPVAAVDGKSITTLEGLPAWYAKQKGLSWPSRTASSAAGTNRRTGASMRLLLQRHDHQGC
jgi:aerobic-type carbon monoxide dehydrogenase small subunit (CoxS/CutS family)